MVVLQQLDAVDRGEGEQGRLWPLLGRVVLLDRTELAVQDRDQEVAVPGCWLKEGLVDEVGACLQLLADQIEHPVDHVARSEDLTVGPDTVPRLHELFLDDRLRHRHWCPPCRR